MKISAEETPVVVARKRRAINHLRAAQGLDFRRTHDYENRAIDGVPMGSEREAKYWDEFRGVIAQKLDVGVERVEREAIISDLGADSLDIVDVLMDLEDRFNIVISEQSAAELKSVGAFFDFVYAKIGPDAA